jgi:hypothetical protein
MSHKRLREGRGPRASLLGSPVDRGFFESAARGLRRPRGHKGRGGGRAAGCTPSERNPDSGGGAEPFEFRGEPSKGDFSASPCWHLLREGGWQTPLAQPPFFYVALRRRRRVVYGRGHEGDHHRGPTGHVQTRLLQVQPCCLPNRLYCTSWATEISNAHQLLATRFSCALRAEGRTVNA